MRQVMLFISSYIPLYVLLVIKNILERCTDKGKFNITIEKIKTVKLFDEINDFAIVILIVLCIISFVYLLRITKKSGCSHSYKIIRVDDQTGNIYFNYISVYLLSCLGLSLNNIVDVFVLLFLMVLVGSIYISNHMTYMNPVLQFIGYKVYEGTVESPSTNQEFKSIIIAKKDITIQSNVSYTGSGKEDFIHIEKEK